SRQVLRPLLRITRTVGVEDDLDGVERPGHGVHRSAAVGAPGALVFAPQTTRHARSPGTRPASHAANGTAAAGSTASRNSSHRRACAASSSASVTSTDTTPADDSTANGTSPTRVAPSAEAATESTGESTGR